MNKIILPALLAFCTLLSAAAYADPFPPRDLKILFLGDNGHHQPALRFSELQPVLKGRGILLTYTDRTADLNAENLAEYDGLLIYANITEISPAQEKALLDFVEGGKGLIPLHCASFCFHNSEKYVQLVGAQFQKHGTGTFREEITKSDHPILKGYGGFDSWDETYVHHRHNEENRTVLTYRVEGENKEPWTWVRTQGEGRVFYTAWGHDHRTWRHPGFHNLVERGIRWAVKDHAAAAGVFSEPPEMTEIAADLPEFKYVPANVPFYPAGKSWGTQEQGERQMQLPLSPSESMKHIVTPDGFELQLFASEPEIGGKPICMNWDEQGRLWIAETVDYPNEMQQKGKGRDRIRICEDTDNDGKADKFTVFAENLSIPTSLIFARGGVIVHQAPDTLFLVDENGDDVADRREVLFTGWATNDTHAGPSNLRYGLDNWLYGMVGYAGFEGNIGGEKQSFRTGFYRFRADASKLEFLRNTNNNSWGVGFTEDGLLVGSTANGCPSVYLPIPNRYYESVRGWSSSVLGNMADNAHFYPITEKVRQVDHHGSFTAGAGHAVYTARTYPRQYWNRTAFVNGPTGHLTAAYVLSREGSDLKSKNTWNLVASDDEWCAPIVAEVGPDGQVWVIDWYNYIVQHNPTPAGFKNGKGNAYETDLRDKKHGRIYRVVYQNSAPQDPLTLKDASPEKLVETLKHRNMLWRLHAQRLLVERQKTDVVPALVKLAGDDSLDGAGLNCGVIHALWTLHGLGQFDGKSAEPLAVAAAALKHDSAGVRRNAALVLPKTAEGAKALLSAGTIQDADGHVRLAAILSLAEMPASSESAAAILKALADPQNQNDRWIPDALTAAAAGNAGPLLASLAKEPGQPHAKTLAVAVRAAEHLARGGEGPEITALLPALAAGRSEVASAAVQGIAAGWPKEGKIELDDAAEKGLAQLVASVDAGARGKLINLASAWGSSSLEKYAEEVAASFRKTVADEKLPDNQRVAAAGRLIEFKQKSAEEAEELLLLISPQTSPEFGQGIVTAVGKSQAEETGGLIVENLSAMTPAVRPAAVKVLLAQAAWTGDLLAALEAGELSLRDLSLDQQQALAAHPDKDLAARAKKLMESGGSLPDADREKVLKSLLPITEIAGDPAAGKQVFVKQCAKCHTHGGEGKQIGPDLTGMAVHPKHELLTHIIDPSRSVEGNFRVYSLITEDGRVLSGLLASESRTALELIDAEGKTHSIQREDIDELLLSAKSLMPEGFEKTVTKTELTDLLEFLTQRGKFLPIPLQKAATVVSTQGMFFEKTGETERMIFDDWSPKTFEGVPFQLVDPQGDRVANAILLFGPKGNIAPTMPKSVDLPCNSPAKAIHFLSGVSGWGHPFGKKGTVSMIVRLHYADGKTEDHPLKNGEHFADYIRRVDVPGSKLAFMLRNQQLRYLAVFPQRPETISHIELVKGEDESAPIVMAVTIEGP